MNSGPEMALTREQVRAISDEVDRALRAFVQKQPLGEFYDLMRYELGWRTPEMAVPRDTRALLCVLACRGCGGTMDRALPMAMAVALLHSFERIQEDMERQRESSRGRPTVWSVWGAPQAMNAGDGMHALAKMALLESRGEVSASLILHLEEEIDEACLRVCEIIHQELRGGEPAALHELAARKSAVLFGCAAYGGCCLAGGDEPRRMAMRRFGELIGSAMGLRRLDAARAAQFYEQAVSEVLSAGWDTAQGDVLRDFARYLMESEA